MNKIFIVAILLIFTVLKLFHLMYRNKMKKKTYKLVNVMNKRVPYKKYEKVSSKMSPSNTIQRQKGDFLDFILENDDTDTNAIENSLLDVYGDDLV